MGMGFSIEKPDGKIVCPDDFENYVPYCGFNITSPECCGWLQVSNMSSLEIPIRQEALLHLMHNDVITPANSWSKVEDENVSFTLYCVVTQDQPIAYKWLIDNGWIPLPEFFNPNTDNTCKPLMFIPEKLKVKT